MYTTISILLLLLFASGMWFIFLRPVPRRSAFGTITHKTFKPAGEYYQYPGGDRTNFSTPTRIPIAECYVFQIELEGQAGTAVYSLNTTAAERFAVGQRVAVTYEKRGVPFLWSVSCVLEMQSAD